MHAFFLPKSSAQSQDTMFLLRSTLNSHGLSILQKSSTRSLQSQTLCYSFLSGPGHLLLTPRGSPYQNSDQHRRMGLVTAAIPCNNTTASHSHCPSALSPTHTTPKWAVPASSFPHRTQGPLLATEFKSLIRNLRGREPGKMENQMYTSHAHVKAKRGFITNAAQSKSSCLKSLGTCLVV